jgi:hypothetical protein
MFLWQISNKNRNRKRSNRYKAKLKATDRRRMKRLYPR